MEHGEASQPLTRRKVRLKVSDATHVSLHAGEFENAALFLQFGLPSTLIRHEDGAFRKRSSNRRNLKTPALHFRVDGNHFENGALPNR